MTLFSNYCKRAPPKRGVPAYVLPSLAFCSPLLLSSRLSSDAYGLFVGSMEDVMVLPLSGRRRSSSRP